MLVLSSEVSCDGVSSGCDPVSRNCVSVGTHSSFIERIHRHLTVTFSLRSFPRGHNAESEDAAEAAFSFANFLLPAREDATAYVKCYFEHVSAVPRSPRLHSPRP